MAFLLPLGEPFPEVRSPKGINAPFPHILFQNPQTWLIVAYAGRVFHAVESAGLVIAEAEDQRLDRAVKLRRALAFDQFSLQFIRPALAL
ncbi:hypothetical protein A6R70_14710 [Agrobacterium rubi]|nr:hypothetical protein [Agrobacterium rubi]